MLRPSRPMILPFISSPGRCSTETTDSLVCSLATRWMASVTIRLARSSPSRRACVSASRTISTASRLAWFSMAATSSVLACSAVSPAARSSTSRRSSSRRASSARWVSSSVLAARPAPSTAAPACAVHRPACLPARRAALPCVRGRRGAGTASSLVAWTCSSALRCACVTLARRLPRPAARWRRHRIPRWPGSARRPAGLFEAPFRGAVGLRRPALRLGGQFWADGSVGGGGFLASPEPSGSRPCARRRTTHLRRRTAQGSRSPRSLQRLCCSWHTSILLAGPGSVVRSQG